MPFLLTVATDDVRRVVVESLRLAADQRARVARRHSAAVDAEKRAGKDVRSSAMKIAALLDEANTLAQAADELAASTDVLMVERVNVDSSVTVHAPDGTTTVIPASDPDDDGTSAEAQAAAELAGLTPDPDAVEDELGALPEDVPAVPETVL